VAGAVSETAADRVRTRGSKEKRAGRGNIEAFLRAVSMEYPP